MKKNLFYIYSFAVCFISIIVSLISLGFFLVGFVSFLQPKLTMDRYQFKCHQSNENYESCLGKSGFYNSSTNSYQESSERSVDVKGHQNRLLDVGAALRLWCLV